MPTVNENTTAYVTASFLNKSSQLVVPNSISYRIDCKATNTELVDWTGVSPASSIEITIPSSVNSIQDPNNPYEDKLVTVKATYGEDDESNAAYTYTVKNLSGIPEST